MLPVASNLSTSISNNPLPLLNLAVPDSTSDADINFVSSPATWSAILPPSPFGVSLDYLVGEGINASFDKQTVKRLQQIQSMDNTARTNLFAVIDAVIRDYNTRQAYAS